MKSILIDLGFILLIAGVVYLKSRGIDTVIDDLLAALVGFYVGSKSLKWKE
jgi:hypothetical protein